MEADVGWALPTVCVKEVGSSHPTGVERMLFGKRYSLIGLDMGSRSMKAAQVSRSGTQVRVEAAAVIPYASAETTLDEQGMRRLRDVLHRQGFHGHNLVVAAPADKLHVELLDLPPRHSGAPVDQIAQAEMM